MTALFLLSGIGVVVAALLALHFRVCDLEAALREHGILSEGVRELISPPSVEGVYQPTHSGETPSPPRGGTGTRAPVYRNHRAVPAPHRVSNPDKPTSRPSGPLPDPPPTGRARYHGAGPKP